MAPTFFKFKELRRRSRASFRTDHSTDTASEGAVSHDTAPSSGSVTPPSIAHQSDPALNLQVKDAHASHQDQAQSQTRPMLAPSANTSRHSVSGMSGLGSPSSTANGRKNIPTSQYAPRVHNISDNAWVCWFILMVNPDSSIPRITSPQTFFIETTHFKGR